MCFVLDLLSIPAVSKCQHQHLKWLKRAEHLRSQVPRLPSSHSWVTTFSIQCCSSADPWCCGWWQHALVNIKDLLVTNDWHGCTKEPVFGPNDSFYNAYVRSKHILKWQTPQGCGGVEKTVLRICSMGFMKNCTFWTWNSFPPLILSQTPTNLSWQVNIREVKF